MSRNLQTGLTSIIVPCFNQRAFTQVCFQELDRHTRPDWELIVVDNGSTDDTAGYLARLRDELRVPVTVITNAVNLGFPRAINQGLDAARGDYLVLLNNDAVVTANWLDQLIALTRAQTGLPGHTRGIGLAGPMTNFASPPQLIESVPYRDLQEMESFARDWGHEHRGQWFTVSKLSGFCLLMTRAVHEAVGGLDARFGLGLFDDDDLAMRARRAGFELAVAHDLFVHHFGSRTFQGNGIDAARLLDEN
jgi:GT2 family glycosyltransferase